MVQDPQAGGRRQQEIGTVIRGRERHATNGELLRELAIAGLGIVVEPTFIMDKSIQEGLLVPILEDWTIGRYHLYALYLTRNFLPTKVRVFIDFLAEMASITA